eukprot:COSAG04_NODE_760_length_10536_cov_15.103564_2_plen_266_part_00
MEIKSHGNVTICYFFNGVRSGATSLQNHRLGLVGSSHASPTRSATAPAGGSTDELNTFLLLVSPLQCLGTPVGLAGASDGATRRRGDAELRPSRRVRGGARRSAGLVRLDSVGLAREEGGEFGTILRADVRNGSHLHLSSDSARHHFLPSFTPLLRCRMQSYTVGGDFSPAPCFPSSSSIPDPFCISSTTSHAQSRRVKRLLRHTTPNLIGFESKQRLYKRCRFGSAPVESPGRRSPSPSRSSSQNQTAAPATPLKATNRLLWGF